MDETAQARRKRKPRELENVPVLLRPVDHAAHQLQCGRSSIYELCDAGKLEMVKLGRATRITERSIVKLVDELAAEARKAAEVA
jgi:excisionase family DNA binding protein